MKSFVTDIPLTTNDNRVILHSFRSPKADAQEALAELYTTVGMLEPFECRFIIDIMERSMRDVLLVVPDDLRPIASDGRMVELKPYEPYVSQADQSGGDESMGIDFEYVIYSNCSRYHLHAL